MRLYGCDPRVFELPHYVLSEIPPAANDAPPPERRPSKFAMLRDAFKGAWARWQHQRTPEARAVYDYIQDSRAASAVLSKMGR